MSLKVPRGHGRFMLISRDRGRGGGPVSPKTGGKSCERVEK